jgi:hypothetical protein
VTTTSVQNSTNSLRSDILPDNSIQTGANAGSATSFLVALDFHELVAASVNFSPAPKPASEATPSKSSESDDSSLAQSAATSYLVTGVHMPVQATLKIQTNQPETTQGSADSMHLLTRVAAHPKVNLQSAQSATQAGIASAYPFTGAPQAPLEAASLEGNPKIETIPVSTQDSTDSGQAASSTSSDSSCNLNPNGDETLQNLAWPPPSAEAWAQLFSTALFAFPTTGGLTISRFQESMQSVNNLTAGLSQPTALNGSQSRKNSTTEGSTSSSHTMSGQSGNISIQSSPIELLQPVDAVPIQPIPSDPSLTNSAEPVESPRFSGIERQLDDRNNVGSDETQISTTRDDTASSDPIAFEAKISSLAAAGNVNEKTAPDPNSPIPTVTRQVDPVESLDAAEVKPEGLSPSSSAAMDSFSGTPSGDTQRPTTTAPEMPITAQLDRLLETERHAESNQPISVSLTSTADGPVSVRFVERSGEVHVTVRAADPVLAQDLRSGLSDLSGRLEHAGFRAEVSSQSGTDPNLRRDSEQGSPDSRNSGRQNPQPQREPEDAPPDRRNPHTSKFAVSVNNLIKEQDA